MKRLLLVTLLLALSFSFLGSSCDSEQGDDDTVADDDVLDDDALDDDALDDDAVDDDAVDDDAVDDDTADDDAVDDDTVDDDATDDDTVDDDASDDDTVVDDDLALDEVTIERADAGWAGFSGASVAADADGVVYVAAVKGPTLYLYRYDGNEITAEAVVNDAQRPHLAIDQADHAHIAYETISLNSLVYATNASGAWEFQTVGYSLDFWSESIAIAVDSAGYAHLVWGYYFTYYATNRSGSWVVEELLISATSVDIAVDANDQVHISGGYLHLVYATKVDDEWQYETIETGYIGEGKSGSTYVGWGNSLALDDEGRVHISYRYYWYYSGYSSIYLRHAVQDEEGWTIENVRYGQFSNSSIAMDSAGTIWIAYVEGSLDGLGVANNADESWSTEEVSGQYLIDGSYPELIAYGDGLVASYPAEDFMLYFWNETSGWEGIVLDESREGGGGSSLILDAAGEPVISSLEQQGNGLVVTTHNGGEWETTEVSAPTGLGEKSVLALDGNGAAHVASGEWYYTNASGSWSGEKPNAGDFVNGSALALDGADQPYVVLAGDGLWLASPGENQGDWVSTEIDESSCDYPSIAIDESGAIHLAYLVWGDYVMRYATNASGDWEITTPDGDDCVGTNTAIAVDDLGHAYIAYHDYGNLGLKFATNASGSWQTALLSSDDLDSNYASIVLDDQNRVHIAYFHVGYVDRELRYVTNRSGVWHNYEVFMMRGMDNDEYLGTSLKIDDADRVHISFTCDMSLGYATFAVPDSR